MNFDKNKAKAVFMVKVNNQFQQKTCQLETTKQKIGVEPLFRKLFIHTQILGKNRKNQVCNLSTKPNLHKKSLGIFPKHSWLCLLR